MNIDFIVWVHSGKVRLVLVPFIYSFCTGHWGRSEYRIPFVVSTSRPIFLFLTWIFGALLKHLLVQDIR